ACAAAAIPRGPSPTFSAVRGHPGRQPSETRRPPSPLPAGPGTARGSAACRSAAGSGPAPKTIPGSGPGTTRRPPTPGRRGRGGDARGRKVKGTIHWVSASHAVPAEVRLYDNLFSVPKPDEVEDVKTVLNPRSLETLTGCRVEPSLAGAAPESRYQFERQGYFCVDGPDSLAAGL